MFSPERVHHYQPTPGTNDVRLVKVTPYVRLRNGDEPPLYLQNNEFWSEGGELIPQERIPGWAWQQVKLCNPVVLKEANFVLDVDAILRRMAGPEEPPSDDKQSIATEEATKGLAPKERQSRRILKRPIKDAAIFPENGE